MPQMSPRKATNLTLDATLVGSARELGVNLSQAAEDGIRRAVAQARADHWRLENHAALDSSNEFVEANGLPLEKWRLF